MAVLTPGLARMKGASSAERAERIRADEIRPVTSLCLQSKQDRTMDDIRWTRIWLKLSRMPSDRIDFQDYDADVVCAAELVCPVDEGSACFRG